MVEPAAPARIYTLGLPCRPTPLRGGGSPCPENSVRGHPVGRCLQTECVTVEGMPNGAVDMLGKVAFMGVSC